MLFALQVQVAATCPDAVPPKNDHPKALVTYDDYPAEAVRNHWEGVVRAQLSIDPEGRVVGCSIIQSSGHKVLDDATCNIIMRRARFTPALDQNCNPVPDTFITPPITWRLP
jgi:periplasmic protein TonB